MNDQLPFIIGLFIGNSIFVLIFERITGRIIKGKLPKLVGLPRTLVYVGVPIILILVLNSGVIIFPLINAVIHGVLYV